MWNVNGRRRDDCCRPAKEMRGCTPTEVAYKCVHDNGDGTYTSCWAGGEQPHDTLDYNLDCVTTAPAGSEGIFTQETREGAFKQAHGDLGFVVSPCAVLEVLCLGKKNRYGRYDQVLVTDVLEKMTRIANVLVY